MWLLALPADVQAMRMKLWPFSCSRVSLTLAPASEWMFHEEPARSAICCNSCGSDLRVAQTPGAASAQSSGRLRETEPCKMGLSPEPYVPYTMGEPFVPLWGVSCP